MHHASGAVRARGEVSNFVTSVIKGVGYNVNCMTEGLNFKSYVRDFNYNY